VTPAASPLTRSAQSIRSRLLEVARVIGEAGSPELAGELREIAEGLDEFAARDGASGAPPLPSTAALHEIHNALVGIRGHARLLMASSAGEQPRVRDGLEVILRESSRIEKAAAPHPGARLAHPGVADDARA